MIRKIIQVGTSRAISIPKTWLDYYEKKAGVEIKEVAMEVNRVLTIKPIIPKKKEALDRE